jgi:tetratricopeptide (TPR) repeat protein
MIFYNKASLKKGAEKCVAQGNLEKAVSLYQKILNREPHETDVLTVMGELQIRLGRKRDGLECLRQVAEVYQQGSEPSKAIIIFKKLSKHAPEDLDILTTLADLQLQGGQTYESVQTLTRAAQLAVRADAGKAIFFHERILKIDPENLDSLAALGELYTRQRMDAKAQDYNFRAGKKYFEKGNFAKSYLHLYAVVQQEPTNRAANLMILQTLIRLKSYDDALMHWQTMSRGDQENDLELLRYKADILMELDRREELKNLLHRMSFLVPDGYTVIFAYVDRVLATRNYPLVLELLELLDLSQYHSFSTKIQEVLNGILAEDENHTGALQKLTEFKVFIGDIHSVMSLYSKLYTLYLKNNELRKAIQLLEKWMNLDEENEWVRQEIRRLRLQLDEEAQQRTDLIRGKLEDISLPDVIQMLESARKTGTLQIRFADRLGRIFFQNGGMIHASFKESVGEEAILQLFRLQGGDFIFEPVLPPNLVQTITGSNTSVVLDVLRVMDEETHKLKKKQASDADEQPIED